MDGINEYDAIIDRALAEDLGGGDVTSRCTVPESLLARARVIVRETAIVACLPVFERVFKRVESRISVEFEVIAGEDISAGSVVARLHGPARGILAGERTALNLLGRAMGVATMTRRYVELAGPKLRVTDTRKTMPGLRILDREAVRCGGGRNHRDDLAGGVLIKENHITCAGGIRAAIEAARAGAPHGLAIECEVRNVTELAEALSAGAAIVLLDNMSDAEVSEAVKFVAGRALVEVSGGVTLDRLPRLAGAGVDIVSVGALTHSARAADLSLLIDEFAPA